MPNILKMPVMGRGGYLVSEAKSMYRSRDEFIAQAPAAGALPGTIMGRLTTGNKAVVPLALTGTTGAEVVTGILFEGLAPNELAMRTLDTRDCEVVAQKLVYPTGATAPQIATIDAALRALGIIVRT